MKLKDELRTAEMKMIWRWEKKKISLGLKNIITEIDQNRLRNRKFFREVRWKQDNISYRLATRAMKDIKDIEIA